MPSMDSLPTELLRDIFLKTLPCVRNVSRIPYSESISSPLRVSHVCRSLRKLALSFPELWSYLCMSLFRQRKRELTVEIFDTWMARTIDGPINFTIDYVLPSDATTRDHEYVEYIFTALVENQHRWKDVSFHCGAMEFSPRFPVFNLTDMPILTSLTLELDPSLHAVVNFKSSSSRLRRLRIRQLNLDLVGSGRLSQLEQVVLFLSSHEGIDSPQSNQSVLSCLELLKNAPSLRRVSITTTWSAPPAPLPLDGGRILLTGLRELFLMGAFGSHLPAAVVDAMTLPSLERFEYCSTIGREKLLRFFLRSAPPLTRLYMGWEDACEESLIDILRLLSHLQDLTLSDARLSHRLFHELTVPDGANDNTSATEQIVCPRLSFLELYYFSSEKSTWLESLVTMVKSRAFILGTFRTVTYYSGSDTDRTVAIADIDNYIDDIKLSRCITFTSLQGLDDA